MGAIEFNARGEVSLQWTSLQSRGGGIEILLVTSLRKLGHKTPTFTYQVQRSKGKAFSLTSQISTR